MGWFNPSDELSAKAEHTLRGLADSGSSEAATVADCLNTIADNGDEQAEDEYLAGCAEQIAGHALAVAYELTTEESREALMARFWEGVDQTYTHIGVIRAMIEQMSLIQIRRTLEDLESE